MNALAPSLSRTSLSSLSPRVLIPYVALVPSDRRESRSDAQNFKVSVGTTYRLPLAVLAAICAVPSAWPQAPKQTQGSATSYEFALDSTKQWMDSNIDLRAGEKLHVSATGTITYPAADASKSPARSFGPDGLARGWADLVRQYPVPDAAHGELIARLGSGEGAQPFPVGVTREYQAPVAGRLFLGINQSLRDAAGATGGFHIRIEKPIRGQTRQQLRRPAGPPTAAFLPSWPLCSMKSPGESPTSMAIPATW